MKTLSLKKCYQEKFWLKANKIWNRQPADLKCGKEKNTALISKIEKHGLKKGFWISFQHLDLKRVLWQTCLKKGFRHKTKKIGERLATALKTWKRKTRHNPGQCWKKRDLFKFENHAPRKNYRFYGKTTLFIERLLWFYNFGWNEKPWKRKNGILKNKSINFGQPAWKMKSGKKTISHKWKTENEEYTAYNKGS